MAHWKRAVTSAAIIGVAAVPMPGAAQSRPDAGVAAVRSWVESHEHAIVEPLVDLVKLPNVAADQPDIRRNAAMIQSLMEKRGIHTRLLESGGSPVIYGELPAPGATATMLIYAHYDGQPVDSSRWVGSGPFDPVLRAGRLDQSPAILPWPAATQKYDPNWRVYGRSASDDKAPIIAMLAALDAMAANHQHPSVNLKFLFEGEEEAGSPHLASVMRANAGLLHADVAIIADGPVYPSNAPTISFGARGVVSAELTVYGATHPLHSGHYGNWAPNPAQELASLLAAMKDSTGRVLIPGWYDDVVAPGPAERAALDALAALPENEAERRSLGIADPRGGGKTRWEMVMQPSLNIDGLESAWVGPESRTIIPSVAIAHLDMRLVPNIRPQDQVARLRKFLQDRGFFVVDHDPDMGTRLAHAKIVKLISAEGYPAVRTALDLPAARAVIASLRRVAGQDLVVIPTMGGSVPGYLFPEVTGAPFVGLPIVNPDNNQHSPNENLRLGNLFRGVELFAALMQTHLPKAGAASEGGPSQASGGWR